MTYRPTAVATIRYAPDGSLVNVSLETEHGIASISAKEFGPWATPFIMPGRVPMVELSIDDAVWLYPPKKRPRRRK